ncbi:MAG TPA: NAD kinase [Alphaproteobacteria bacterium]|nr:NAD kinase [Alphaproteobacteria bacterium]
MNKKYKNIGIVCDSTEKAQSSKNSLLEAYNLINIIDDGNTPEGIDAIIALGGDGFMLQTLHNHITDNIPIYGLNKGSIGFLLNEYSEHKLIERLNNAVDSHIHPLKMECKCAGGEYTALAINEVSLLRTTGQAAKIKINVDGTTYLDELICDGVMVATPAGSSAYNYSNGGMILPIGSNLLSLVPISPFRPRRWRGALLQNNVVVEFIVHKPWRRPVKAVADNYEVENVTEVKISLDTARTIHLLFDPGHSLEERIMREQFEVC